MNNHVRCHVPSELDKFTEKELLRENIYACESVCASVYAQIRSNCLPGGLYQFTSLPVVRCPT